MEKKFIPEFVSYSYCINGEQHNIMIPYCIFIRECLDYGITQKLIDSSDIEQLKQMLNYN
jgi:hypothetical protein